MYESSKRANLNIEHCIYDLAVILLVFFGTYLISFPKISDSVTQSYFVLLAAFLVIYVSFMMNFGMYNITTFLYLDRVLKVTARSFISTSVLIFIFLFWTYNSIFSRTFLLLFLTIGLVLILVEKVIIVKGLNKAIVKSRAIYVGNADLYKKVVRFSTLSGFCFDMIGYIQMNDTCVEGLNCLGDATDFENIMKKNHPEQVIFTHSTGDSLSIEPYLNILNDMGITARVVLDLYQLDLARSYVCSIGTYPMLTYYSVSVDRFALLIKRCMDIVGALVGILFFLPIMLGVSAAIKLDSKGPVIFEQERVGYNGKKFKIYKFRSMCTDAEAQKKQLMAQNQMGDEKIFKMKDDPRITKVGKFIRKTSMDELPQFFNVLKGEMSLVGTRPPTVDEVRHYDRHHWRRISIKPGITGIWQTSGRNQITDFEEIVKMDISYIESWSLKLDILLLLKTVRIVLMKNGAY